MVHPLSPLARNKGLTAFNAPTATSQAAYYFVNRNNSVTGIYCNRHGHETFPLELRRSQD